MARLPVPDNPSVFARPSVEGSAPSFLSRSALLPSSLPGPGVPRLSRCPQEAGGAERARPLFLYPPFLTFNYLISSPPAVTGRIGSFLTSCRCGEPAIVPLKTHSGPHKRIPSCFSSHIRPLQTRVSVCGRWTWIQSQ